MATVSKIITYDTSDEAAILLLGALYGGDGIGIVDANYDPYDNGILDDADGYFSTGIYDGVDRNSEGIFSSGTHYQYGMVSTGGYSSTGIITDDGTGYTYGIFDGVVCNTYGILDGSGGYFNFGILWDGFGTPTHVAKGVIDVPNNFFSESGCVASNGYGVNGIVDNNNSYYYSGIVDTNGVFNNYGLLDSSYNFLPTGILDSGGLFYQSGCWNSTTNTYYPIEAIDVLGSGLL